jgi:putative ABC transport system permease protein
MNLFKIAWRNIWRNKLRSIAVMASVVLGLVAGVFSSAMVEGMMNGRFQNFIEKELSHIQVHHPEFIGQHEIFQTTQADKSVLNKVLDMPLVKSAAIRTKTQSMIASATFTGGVQLSGISPEHENNTTGFAENIIEGEYLDKSDRNAILIGESLAEKMKVGVGSRIVLTFQDAENEIISSAFRVKGIFETYYTRFDENNAFVNLEYINEYLKIGNEFHEMAILAHDAEQLDNIVADVQPLFPEMKVRKWNEISPELDYWVEMGSVFSFIFIGVIMIGLAFGLLNTMLMAVFERTKELGMLMAIGMNKTKVFSLIVLETVALSLTGTTVGMILAYLIIAYTKKNGIDLSAFSDVMKEIGFENMIYPVMNWNFYSIVPFVVFFTALLAAIYPAMKALSLNPADAVRK